MDLRQEFMQNLRGRYPSIVSGAVRINTDGGRVWFESALDPSATPIGSTIEEATAHVLRFNVTKADIGGAEGSYMSRDTPRMVRELRRRLAQKAGGNYRVDLYSFSPDTDQQWDSIQSLVRRDDGVYGLLTPDDESTSLLRIFRDNQELTTEQVLAELEEVGLRAGDLTRADIQAGKFGLMDPRTGQVNKSVKRRKTMVANKAYEAIFSGEPQFPGGSSSLVEGTIDAQVASGAELKIGVFDDAHFQFSEDVTENLRQYYGQIFDDMSARQQDMIAGQLQSGQLQSENTRISTRQAFIDDRMATAAETASDGISIGGEKFFKKMRRAHEELIADLSEELRRAQQAGDALKVRSFTSQIRTVQRELDTLNDTIARRTGIFNIRHLMDMQTVSPNMQQQVPEIGDKLLEALTREGVDPRTLKGNIVFNEEALRRYIDHYGFVHDVDIVTHLVNLKKEFGIDSERGGVTGYTTLSNRFETSTSVLLDEQTISSNADIFGRRTIEAMSSKSRQRMEDAISSMKVNGVVPAEFVQVLMSMARSSSDESSKRAAMEVLDAINVEGYDIRTDKVLFDKALDTIRKGMFREKHGHRSPKLFLDSTMRGEIIDHSRASDSAQHRIGGGHVLIDSRSLGARGNLPILTYDTASDSLVMHAAQVVKYKASWGGFDLDDAVMAMLRMTDFSEASSTGYLYALGIRQPNTAGEALSFAVAINDPLVIRMLRERSKELSQGTVSITGLDGETKRFSASGLISRLERAASFSDLIERAAEEGPELQMAYRELYEHTFQRGEIGDISSRIQAQLDFSSLTGRTPVPYQRPGMVLGSERIVLGVGGYQYPGSSFRFADLDSTAESSISRSLLDAADRLGIEEHQTLGFREQVRIFEEAGLLTEKPQSAIGLYINPRMVFDQWMQNLNMEHNFYDDPNTSSPRGATAIRIRGDETIRSIVEDIRLIETELLIDEANVKFARQKAEELVTQIYRLAAYSYGKGYSDLLLDQALVERRISGHANAKQKGIEQAIADLAESEGHVTISESDLYLDEDHRYSRFSALQRHGEIVDEVFEKQHYNVPQRIASYTIDPGRGVDVLVDRMIDAARVDLSVSDPFRFAAEMDSAARVMDVFRETLHDGKSTRRTWETLARVIQRAANEYGAESVVRVLNELSVSTTVDIEGSAPGAGSRILSEEEIEQYKRQRTEWSRQQRELALEEGYDRIEDMPKYKRLERNKKLLDDLINAPDGAVERVPSPYTSSPEDLLPEVRQEIRSRPALNTVNEFVEAVTSGKWGEFGEANQITEDRINEIAGRRSRADLRRNLSELLTGDAGASDTRWTLSAVDELEKGLVSRFGRTADFIPDDVMSFFPESSPYSTTRHIGSLFSRAMYMLNPGGDQADRAWTNLAQEVERYMSTNVGEARDAIRSNILTHLDELQDALARYVGSTPDADEGLRDYVFRSMERSGMADEAAQIRENMVPEVSGGQYRRMSRAALTDLMDKVPPGVKKGFGFGAAAMMALAVVNRVRNKEHTRNDMQGPAFMPGGTPYDEGFPMDTSHMYAPSGGGFGGFGGGGTTYEISGRGGSYNDSFVSDLSAIVGSSAAVSANISDGQLPFRSEGARERLLREYS